MGRQSTVFESSAYRARQSITSGVTSQLASAPWKTLLPAALVATQNSVNLWATSAGFSHGIVNGPTAIGPPGLLKGSSFQASMRHQFKKAGAKPAIAETISSVVWKAWKAWADGVTVPGLPWYPPFANWPGPHAPLTSNVPTTVATTPSAGTNQILRLGTDLKWELGKSVMSEAGAAPFVSAYSLWIITKFTAWSISAKWTGVMGMGPVPSYAPPVVTSGPVVNGRFFGGSVTGW